MLAHLPARNPQTKIDERFTNAEVVREIESRWMKRRRTHARVNTVQRLDDESGFRPWTALAVFVIFNIAAVLIWRIILALG